MVRFDEMLDGVISTTKSVVKTAGQKTTELVEIGKLKYKKATLTRDLEKAYGKLGALVYEAKLKGEDLGSITQMALEEITKLNEELDALEKNMFQAKENFDKPLEQTVEKVEEIPITAPWEDKEDSVADKVDEKLETFADKAGDFFDKTKDKVGNAFEYVGDKAKSAFGKAEDKAENALDNVEDKIESFSFKTEDQTKKLEDDIEDIEIHIKDKVENIENKAKDKNNSFSFYTNKPEEAKITDEMKQAADAISVEVDEMADEIISRLEDNNKDK